MNIIIPMAGQGQRFMKSGFSLPKPLISVAGKAMYRHAVDCLPLTLATRLVFILKQNEFTGILEREIQSCYASYPYHILILEQDTRGQAETVLKSSSLLELDQPTLVHNCDTGISETLPWQDILQQDSEGALVLFPSQEDRWSYAQLDSSQTYIVDVQEKKVISPYASTGTYFFKNTRALVRDIQTLLNHNKRQHNEFYLSSVYPLMLNRHERLKPLQGGPILCFGTPQDLVNSLNQMLLKGDHDQR